MRILRYILFIFLASSCSNDFDVVTQAHPTTFVYCVLNRSDSVHYIRINKSFIVYDNVYQYVKLSDSLYYPDLNLLVEITGYDSRIVSVRPEKIIYLPKDSGLFAREPNILYAFPFNLEKSSKATLRLVIPNNPDTITSVTPIVDSCQFYLPGKWSSNKSISFFGGCYNLHWRTGNGAYNSMRYTFHYSDYLQNDTIPRSFDYRFQSDMDPQGERDFCLRLEDVLYTIKSRIPDRPEVEVRKFDSIDFHIDSADKFLYEYANLFRTNPEEYALINFTNLKNGSGIFSSKQSIHLTGMGLDVQALDSLVNSRVTKHLKFVPYL